MIDICYCCGNGGHDENGKYIGGSWTEITIKNRKSINEFTDNAKYVLICDECLRAPDNVNDATTWVARLIVLFKNYGSKFAFLKP